MLRKVLALAAAALLLVGIGCSNSSSPITPDKGNQSMVDYFNSFDLSDQAVAKYSLTDYDGNLLAAGTLGRNDDGLYVIENRGADATINLSPLGLVDVMVTYNNPAGTIPSGVNAGLPFYYIGQTVDYDCNIISLFWRNLGSANNPATVRAEMHYATFNANGGVVAGALLPGAPIYQWSGIISPGYMTLNDTFQIVAGTNPGLDVTTCQVRAPMFFGLFDVIFYDGISGVWDPAEE
jgi:hypothetical protein